MNVEYDREADAINVHLTEKPKKIAKSREIEDGIVLDMDARKQILGIEVLDVSRRFKEADAFQFAVRHMAKVRSVA